MTIRRSNFQSLIQLILTTLIFNLKISKLAKAPQNCYIMVSETQKSVPRSIYQSTHFSTQ